MALIGISDALRGQTQPDNTSENTAKSLRKVVRETGWPIPNYNRSNFSSSKKTIDDIQIVEKSFKDFPRIETEIELFSLKGNVLVARAFSVDLRNLSVLEANDKAFAYHLSFQQVGISEIAGKMDFGPRIDLYYIDGDGDGIFETRQYCPSGRLDYVPEWASDESGRSKPPPPPSFRKRN